jgi:hypothetical protein
MRAYIGILYSLLTLFNCSFNQDQICGYVVEYPFDIPLPGVSIIVKVYDIPNDPFGYAYVTITGDDGYYSFSIADIHKKYYTLKIERTGYHEYYGGNFNSSHNKWGCSTTVLEQD